MSELKAKDVDGYMRRGPQHPVILVYGPDRGLVAERAAALAKAGGVPLDDPFSSIKLDAAEIEADPPRLADEARTVSMFGGKRLVWVRGSGGAKLASAVADLCAAPPADCLVIIEAGELKKDAALRKAAERADAAVTLPCYPDEGRGIDALIDEVMGANHLALDMDARQWLKARLGGDRLASRGELDKLALYAAGQPRVSLEDAQASTGDVSAQSIDAVVEAVLTGRLAELDAEYAKFIATKTPCAVLLVALVRQLFQLQPLREEIERNGKPLAAVVSAVKPPLFGPRRTLMETALSMWTLDMGGRALSRIAAAQFDARRLGNLDEAVVRQCLLALCSEARRAAASRR